MKILALDLGSVYIGTAISDELHIIADPLKTVPAKELKKFLKEILTTENISTIVVGKPITMKGTQSQQTETTIKEKEALEKEFESVDWVLWDERLTSKMADKIKPKSKDKHHQHSLAAALILDSYLNYLRLQRDLDTF